MCWAPTPSSGQRTIAWCYGGNLAALWASLTCRRSPLAGRWCLRHPSVFPWMRLVLHAPVHKHILPPMLGVVGLKVAPAHAGTPVHRTWSHASTPSVHKHYLYWTFAYIMPCQWFLFVSTRTLCNSVLCKCDGATLEHSKLTMWSAHGSVDHYACAC